MFFEGRLAPSTDDGDLSFVEKVRIHLAPVDDAASLPEIDLFSAYRDPSARKPEIAVEATPESVDLAAYLSGSGAVFGFELSGPASEFPDEVMFDAQMCFSASAHFRQDFIPAP